MFLCPGYLAQDDHFLGQTTKEKSRKYFSKADKQIVLWILVFSLNVVIRQRALNLEIAKTEL